MDKKTISIIATVAVLALIGVSAYLFLKMRQEKQESDQMVEVLKMDKAEMENEYKQFSMQYNEMMSQVKNDSLIAQMAQEQHRSDSLLNEIRKLKADKTSDAAEIMRLKKELATLRQVLRSYILQIDSLNRENQSLRADNAGLRQQNEVAQANISNLSTQNQQLSDKVDKASQLDATGISAGGRNKKGKACDRVKEAKKLGVSFTIARNVTTETGMRTVYIRITTPTGEALSKGGTFQFENRNVPYSMRKEFEYTGEEHAMTLYWDISETLSAGQYHVDICADGHIIGSTSFSLK